MERETIHFITVDTINWANSTYVPKSNGKIAKDKSVDEIEVECWSVDSRNGRWTNLSGFVDHVSEGDEIELCFWAKLKKNPALLRVDFMQSDWELHKEYFLSKSCKYVAARQGKYYLFSMSYRATESSRVGIGINSNDSEITFFPAHKDDIQRFANITPEKGLISKIHPVVTLMKGENYGFCGCMAYLANCLGLDEEVFGFQHFGMATGDIFTQIHVDSLCDCTDCVSDRLFGEDIVKKAFDSIGYGYEYMDGDYARANQEIVFEKIKKSIDHNIPVISSRYEGEQGYDFCIICGYTEDNKIKIMFKENDEPTIQNNLLAITRALVFAGEFIKKVDLKQYYCDITRSIYDCTNRPAERGCTFGKAAFQAWADSLIDGGIKNSKTVDSWCSFAYNLCIVATNVCWECTMIQNMLKHCPEFEQTKAYGILKKVSEQWNLQDKIVNELMEMGYGFHIPSKKLRDLEFMEPAAKKIMEFCKVCDNILEIYSKGDLLVERQSEQCILP